LTDWIVDTSRWRKRGEWEHDVIVAAPGEAYAAVLYGCHEISAYWSIGNPAILGGPPEQPTVLFRPVGMTCILSSISVAHGIHWISSGCCAMLVYKPAFGSALPEGFSGEMYIDVDAGKACFEKRSPIERNPAVPTDPKWCDWAWIEQNASKLDWSELTGR